MLGAEQTPCTYQSNHNESTVKITTNTKEKETPKCYFTVLSLFYHLNIELLILFCFVLCNTTYFIFSALTKEQEMFTAGECFQHKCIQYFR